MSYTAVNTLIDAAFPPGALYYWKSTFLTDLSDDVIDVMVERFAGCPSPMTALVCEHFHGAVTRIPADAMAVPHREPGYNLIIPSGWLDPATTDANVTWTRETFAAIEPYRFDRRYVNYMTEDDQGAVREAFGANYDRLVELKRVWIRTISSGRIRTSRRRRDGRYAGTAVRPARTRAVFSASTAWPSASMMTP